MLKIHNLTSGYGESQILFDVDLEVHQGEIVSLVGSNAAGKTTLVNTISGVIPAWGGKIEFLGEDITKLPAHQRVERGLIQTPEGRHLFPNMTVRENLLLGKYCKRVRKSEDDSLERVYELFPKLYERRNQLAGQMSGGEQQMCAVGRSLMSQPKLLIFDEPSLGLAPIIVDQIFELIERISKDGLTILLIEQNVSKALGIASRGYILEDGRITMTGDGKELLADPQLRAAYLGI